MPQHVLAATDFSAAAKAAAARAAQVAHAHSFELTLVHVFNEFGWSNLQHVLKETPLRPPVEVAARDLRALADELASRYQVSRTHAQVEVGKAAAEIIAVAQTMRPQLIVLGAQGEGLAAELGLGGTATKVLRASPAPVLVVRREAIRPYERVVVGTDFSECSERALVQALELFPEASHTLVHARWVTFEERLRLAGANEEAMTRYRLLDREEAHRRMKGFVDTVDPPRAGDLAARVRDGHPVTALLEHSRLHDTDVIAVGRHSGAALGEKLFGSVPQALLNRATCDVLLVP